MADLNAPKRAALYARISRTDSAVDKVKNQLTELRKLAKSSGYKVVAEFEDDDISAYKGKTPRPGYINLIEAIREKTIDVVMATEPQRLTRGSPTDLDYLSVQCIKAGAVIHTRSGGIQDPATPTVLAMMQIMDVIGGLEVATKVERQKARNRADLEKGLPTKGLRPFGWEKDRISLRESEATIIRDAYKSILESGVTIWGIAQKWNSQGIKTDPMQKPRKSVATGLTQLPAQFWTSTTVRQMLKRPRNAGILMSDGIEMPKSQITPIVSREEYESLLLAIKGENTLKGPKPKYLLGGILECPCGARMHASSSNTKRKGKPKRSYKIYRCRLYGFDKTQKHASIHLPVADDAARTWIVEDIALGLKVAPATNGDEFLTIRTKIAELKSQRSRTEDLIIEGIGDVSKLKTRLREMDSEIQKATGLESVLLAKVSQSDALSVFRSKVEELDYLASDDVINAEFKKGFEAWDALSIDQKRNIIKGNYRVQIGLGGRGFERLVFLKEEASASK
jgi:DNA invertase Pin-like site-specific DNA recombinase